MERGFHLTVTSESMHVLGVPISRREKSPYPMGERGMSLSPEEKRIPPAPWGLRGCTEQKMRSGESLSDGEKRMSLSEDETRVYLY